MLYTLSDAEKQAIASRAGQLGFELFGVTGPETPPHYAVFSRWIAENRHGKMAYLASERSLQRRRDPRLILPECRSILVLGTPYSSPAIKGDLRRSDQSPIRGRVAAYAWGADYHLVLSERMLMLIAFIEKLVGESFPHRIYADTGPVLEKDLAQRAGLGWIGKNTCLINPKYGSYFFLSEILLGLEIDPDKPFIQDHCGACTRCREACPTRCILPDRTIDARRCISYLTIELREEIPEDLRPFIGNWVFGCDICQEVCPWNRGQVRETGDPAFATHEGIRNPDLIHDLDLAAQDFSLKFSDSPLKRPKRAGYLRNIAVCLGNSHNLEGVSALGKALSDPEPLVRSHAAWALGEIGGDIARSWLELAKSHETEPRTQDEILAALARLSN